MIQNMILPGLILLGLVIFVHELGHFLAAKPVDDLEDASDLAAFGSKMGIDATRKWPSEGFTRPWPKRIVPSDAAVRRADELWQQIRKGWKP